MRDELGDSEIEQWSDEELAQAAQSGSIEARNALFLRQQALMKKLAYPAKRLLYAVTSSGRASSAIGPEDIDQQAFIIFCGLLNTWEPARAPFMHYFPKVMHWRLLGYVRDEFTREHTSNRSQDDALPALIPLEARYGNPRIQSAGTGEAESDVEWDQHVSRLPEPLRDTINLRFYHDLSTAQIASMRGRARRTVNRNIQAAISILRQSMEDRHEDCC